MYLNTVINAWKKYDAMEKVGSAQRAEAQAEEAKAATEKAIDGRQREAQRFAESYSAPFAISTPETEKRMDMTYSALLSLYSAQNGGDISAAERRIAQNGVIQAAFGIHTQEEADAKRNTILRSLGLPGDDESFMQEVVDAIPIDGLRKKKSRLYEELILTENEASRRKLLGQIAEIDDDIAKRGRQGEHNVLGNTLIDAVPTATQVTKFALKSALVALAANGIAYGMGASAAINGTFAKIAARPGFGYLADVAGLSGGAGGVASRVVGFYDIYHDERGGAIEELMQLSDSEGRKLDRNTIANYATMIGLVNGLLEFATPDPYTKALLSLSAGNPVRSTVARSISRAVKRGLLTYAGGVLSESTEEGLQGFAGEYIKILAQEYSNAKLGTSFNLSEDRLKQAFSTGWEAFKESVPDMMVTEFLPFAVDTSIEVAKTVKAKKDAEKITPASKEESPAQVHTVTVDSFRNVERKFDSAEDEKSAINEYMHQVQGGATIAPEPEKGEEKSDSGKSAKEKKPAQAKTAPAPADISTVPQDGVVAFSTAPAPDAQPDHTVEEEEKLPAADPNYPVIYIDNGATPWQVNEEHLTPVRLVEFTRADGSVVYIPVDEVEALKVNLARQLGISHVNVTVERANGNTYRTEYYNMAELDRKSAGKVDNGNVYVYIDPSKQTIEGTKTDSGNTRLGAEWNPVPITQKEWDAHLADAFANGIDVSEKKDGSVIAMTKADMKALYDTLVAGRFGEKIRFQNIHAAYSFQSNYNRGKKDSKGNKIAPSPFAGWFEWTYKDENGEEHTVRVVNMESKEYKGHVRKIKEAEAAEAARKAEEKKIKQEQREAEKKKLDEEKAARKAERERKKAEKEAAKAETAKKETALEKLRKDLVSLEDVNNDRKKFNAIIDAVKENEALSDEERAEIAQKAEEVKKKRGQSKQSSATELLRNAIEKAEKNLAEGKAAEEKTVVPEDVSESIDQQKEGIDAKAELEETGNEIESPAETEEVQEATEQVDKAEKVAEEVKVEPASAPAQEEKKDPATEFADSLSFSIDEAREKPKKQRTEMENTVVAILDSTTGADRMMAMARALLHDAEDMLPFFPDGLPESVRSKLAAIQARLEERRQKLRFQNGERGNAMRDLAGFYSHFLAGETEEYDVSANAAVPQVAEQKPAEQKAKTEEKPAEQKQEKPAAKETKPKEEKPRQSGFRKKASPAVSAPANADRKLSDAIHVENATIAEESRKKVQKADKAVEEASKKKADSLSAEEKRKQKIKEELEKKKAEYDTVTIRRAYSGVVKDMYDRDSPFEKDFGRMDTDHYSFSTALDAFKRIIAMFEKTWESRPWILAGGIDKVDKNFGYVLARAKTLLADAGTKIEDPERAESYSAAFREGIARLVDLKNRIASKGRMELPEEAYMPRIEEGASPEKTSLEKARELQPLIKARVFSDMQQAFGTAASSRTAEILAEHIAMGMQLVSEATGIPSAVLLSKKVYVRFVSDADLVSEQKKTDSNGQPLHDVDLKGVRGWEQYDKATGTVSIYLTKNANEKTVLHELAHGLRHLMTPEQNAEFEKVYGIPLGSEWSKEVEERFADDFTRYVDLGSAPTEGLRSIFALLRGILERVKSALGPIDPSVAVAFDRLFSGKLNGGKNAESSAKTSKALYDLAEGETAPIQDKDLTPEEDSTGTRDQSRSRSRDANVQNIGLQLSPIKALRMLNSGYYLTDQLVDKIAEGGLDADENMQKIFQKEQEDRQLMKQFNLLAEASKYTDTQKDMFIEDMVFKYRLENVGKEIKIRDILEKAFAYAHCETPMEARQNFISSFSTRSAIDNLKKNLIGYKAVIVSNGKLVARSLTPRNTRIVGLLEDIGSDLGDAAYNAVFEDIKEHTDEWQDLVFNLTKRRDSIRTSVNENGDVVYSSEMSDDAVYQQYLLSFNSDYHFAPLRNEREVAEKNIRGQAEEEDAEIQKAIAAVTENVRETPSMIDAEPYASMNFSNAQQAIIEEHDLALAIEKKKLQERVDAEIQKAVSECEEKVKKIEAESKRAKKKIEAEMNDRIARLKGNGETREADEKRIREEYAERLEKTVREYATRLATARRLVSYAVKAKTREMNRKMLTQKHRLDAEMQERLKNLRAAMLDRQNRARIERSIKKKMKYNSSTHSARLFDTLQFLCAIRGTKMQSRTMAENEAIMGDLLENRSTLDTLDPTGKQQRDAVIKDYDENAYEIIAVESDDPSLKNVGVARRSDIKWDPEKPPFYIRTLKELRVNVIGASSMSFDSGYIDREGNVHNTTDDDIFALVEQTLNGEVSYSEWSTDAQRKLLEMLNLARGYAAEELQQRKEQQKKEAVESANAMFEDIDPHFFRSLSNRIFAAKQLIAQKFRDAVKREISMEELEDRESLILAIEGADASLYKEEGLFDESGELIVPLEEAIEDYEEKYLNRDGSEKSVEQILQDYFREKEEEVRHYVGLHIAQFMDRKEYGSLKKLWKSILAMIIHPYDLARNLERFKEGGGEFTRVMLREVHDFMDKKTRAVNERRQNFADIFKELFGKDIQYRSGDDLLGSKKVPEGKRAIHYSEDSINAGKEVELTREQMITAYIYARGGENSDSFRNMSNRNGNMFEKADLERISVNPSEFLTDEELRLANYMLKEISRKWDDIASVALEEDNIILERIPYYFPMYGHRQMALDDGKAVQGPVISDASTRGTHERTNGIYPMNLNGISTYLREIEKQEQYINGRHWTKKVQRLVGNRVGNIYNIVDRAYGREFANALYLYLQRITGGEGRRAEDLDGRGLNGIVSRTALAHVAARPLTVIRQMLSTIPGIAGNVGGRNFARAFKAVFMDHVMVVNGEEFDAIEFMKQMDYKIQYRGSGDINIEDYRNEFLSARGHNEKLDWILNMGSVPMEWMDNKVAQLVWFANYLEQMDRLEGRISNFEERQKEACARASDIIASTQSTSRVEDLSSLQADRNPYKRAVLMFTNDLFQMWNLVFNNGVAEGMEKWHSEELASLSKTKRFLKLFAPVATKVLFVPMLVAGCSALISLGWVSDDDDDDDEGLFSLGDFMGDFMKEMAAYIPVGGTLFQRSMESYPDNPVPFVSSGKKAFKTVFAPSERQLKAGTKARALQTGEYLLDTSIEASAYFGIPADAIKSMKRVAKNNFNLFYFISTNAGYATDNLFNNTER